MSDRPLPASEPELPAAQTQQLADQAGFQPDSLVQLWQLIDALPVCISYTDAQRRYQFVNRTYEQWFQKSRVAILGRFVWDVIGAEAYQQAEPFINRALQGESLRYEAKLPYDNGSRYVEAVLIPNLDHRHLVLGYYALVSDISDRKRLHQLSQDSTHKLQDVLASVQAVITRFRLYANYTWEYEYRSPGCEAVFGYTAAELMADKYLWRSRVHPEDVQQIFDWRCSAFFKEGSHTTEYRFFHKDGGLRWISNVNHSRYDPERDCWKVTAVSIDISDRKRVELALQQSQTRLALAQQVANIGYWEYDLSSQRISWSQQLFALYQLPPERGEPSYRELLQLFDKADRKRLKAAVQQALDQGNSYLLDLKRVSIDGSIKYLEVRGEVRTNALGKVIRLFGTTQDITQRKRLETQLQQQFQRRQALQQVQQAIRRSLNLETVFNTAVHETGVLLKVSRVLVVQYVPSEALWHPRAEYRHDEAVPSRLGMQIPDAENQLAEQLRQGETVCLNDSRVVSDPFNRKLAHEFPSGWLIVPLQGGDRLWGSLSISRRLEEGVWQDWEVELAQAVADQLAIAIQQSSLFQQVQQLNTSLEANIKTRTAQLQQALDLEARLKRITDKVRDSLDETQIMQVAVDELASGLEVAWCDAGIYDLKANTITVCYEGRREGIAPVLLPSELGTVLPLDQLGEIYDQLLQGVQVQCCCCERNDSEHLNYSSEKLRLAILACPLVDDQQVLGDIWLFKPVDQAFNELEVRLVQQVANQCAIALRQSRLYQTSQLQVRELERLNQLKDDFLNTVSHELRSPISTIALATNMLEELLHNLGTLDQEPQLANYFQVLREGCDRETRLVNDLLALSHLDAQTEPLLLSTMLLQPWLRHVCEGFDSHLHKHQQTLLFGLPPEPLTLITDFSYLEQVLSELLENACKYTPAQEVIIAAAWLWPAGSAFVPPKELEPLAAFELPSQPSIASLRAVDCVCISVTNTGVEIPPEEHSRVFEKFYRIPSADPWKCGGTGLGLALVKKRVEALRGAIALVSQTQQTTFLLTLPQVHPAWGRA